MAAMMPGGNCKVNALSPLSLLFASGDVRHPNKGRSLYPVEAVSQPPVRKMAKENTVALLLLLLFRLPPLGEGFACGGGG